MLGGELKSTTIRENWYGSTNICFMLDRVGRQYNRRRGSHQSTLRRIRNTNAGCDLKRRSVAIRAVAVSRCAHSAAAGREDECQTLNGSCLLPCHLRRSRTNLSNVKRAAALFAVMRWYDKIAARPSAGT